MIHTFAYTGKELEAPLVALLARQTARLADVNAKISELPSASVEAAQKPPDLMRPAKPVDGTAINLLGERNKLLVGMVETRLWINESRRTPDSVWYLTMSDLALLYVDGDTIYAAI